MTLPARSYISIEVSPDSESSKEILAEERKGLGLTQSASTVDASGVIPVPLTVKFIVSAETAAPS